MRFQFAESFIINSDVEPWNREGLRIAMLGGPGSGKSWNNSLITEQFLSQGGTVVIFQPRDEYFTLKEKFDVLSVGGVHAKDMEFALTSPSIYAKAVVEDGMSMMFYTSAAEDEEKLINWVSRFIQHLLTYQETQKRPILLILEEAQEYAPRSASGHIAPPWVYNRMIKAFKDCFTQGRKLNIIAVASSQRPQELNFTIRQIANLTFYGKFSDQDIGYVDKGCLKYIRKQGIEVDASRLVSLGLGEWLVIMGKQTRFITVTEPRLTKHGAETPRLEYVAPRTTKAKKTVDQLTRTIMEALKKEEAEKSELEKAKRKISDLTKKLEAAEKKAEIKLSVKEMLEAGVPKPELAEKLAQAETEIKDLRKKLAEQKSPEEVGKLRKTITQLNDQLAKLRTSHENLREWKGKLIRQVGALENKNASLKEALESSKKIREVFSELIRGELKRLEWEPYEKGTAGFEPRTAPQGRGFSIVEIDERINQRLAGFEPARVVTVEVNERIKELVKNDYVNRLVAKIQSLPEPAKKAALWLHEKKQAKIGDLYYFMYEKTGRIPGNFYANVVKPLEKAWLIVNEAGNVRWSLEEKLSAELTDVLRDGNVQEIAKYLTSLLL